MRTYKSHKTVQALRIAFVCAGRPDQHEANLAKMTYTVVYEDGSGETLPLEMTARYQPVAGDYLIVYEDGYRALSPAKAFENGYTLVSKEPADEGLAEEVETVVVALDELMAMMDAAYDEAQSAAPGCSVSADAIARGVMERLYTDGPGDVPVQDDAVATDAARILTAVGANSPKPSPLEQEMRLYRYGLNIALRHLDNVTRFAVRAAENDPMGQLLEHRSVFEAHAFLARTQSLTIREWVEMEGLGPADDHVPYEGSKGGA